MAVPRKITTTRGDRWRVRYRDPDGRSRERRFHTRAEADRFAHRVEVDKQTGEYIDPRAGKAPTSEFITRYRSTRVGHRPSTIARDDYLLARYIVPAFGHRRVGIIRPSDVAAFVADLVARGLAPATVRKAHQVLSAVLEVAYRDGAIRVNPARGVDRPPLTHKKMRALEPAEVDTLAAAIRPRYRALVLTAAYTGCRYGELAALRVSRLDLLHRTLQVEETMVEVKGELHCGPPKTPASIRRLALPKGLAVELEQHLANFPPSADGLVFTAGDGGPLRAANFRHRHWTPAVRASVGEPCRFHDLRHSHAAMLIASGQHPKVIQARLGHASMKTTLDIYGHLYEGLDEAAADALDHLMARQAVGFSRG
jgi:integrase